MGMSPIPSAFPTDEAQCVVDCIEGVCKDSPDCQLHCHLVFADYCQGQAVGCPCPPPTPGFDTQATIKKVFEEHKAGRLQAININWLQLAQAILAFALTILSQLFPVTPPAPAPAQAGKKKP